MHVVIYIKADKYQKRHIKRYKEEEKNEKQIGLTVSKSAGGDDMAISNGDRGGKEQAQPMERCQQ